MCMSNQRGIPTELFPFFLSFYSLCQVRPLQYTTTVPTHILSSSFHGWTPLVDLELLVVRISRSQSRHTRQDSSGRVISPSQRPLPDNTTLTAQKHPCRRWDLNPQFHQTSGRRTTPQTAQPLGPVSIFHYSFCRPSTGCCELKLMQCR